MYRKALLGKTFWERLDYERIKYQTVVRRSFPFISHHVELAELAEWLVFEDEARPDALYKEEDRGEVAWPLHNARALGVFSAEHGRAGRQAGAQEPFSYEVRRVTSQDAGEAESTLAKDFLNTLKDS